MPETPFGRPVESASPPGEDGRHLGAAAEVEDATPTDDLAAVRELREDTARLTPAGLGPAFAAAPPPSAGRRSDPSLGIGPPTPPSLRAALPPPRRANTIVGTAPAVASRPASSASFRAGRPAAAAGTMVFGTAVAPEAAEGESTSVGAAPLTRFCTACGEKYPADFVICPRDATPLSDEAQDGGEDPLVGKLLGESYQIVRVVGEGGMGRVYEARHLRLKERRFAVKVLHADLARHADMATRFLREAESASSIHHPNVVDVFDVHHLQDGTPYFVGEFLDGEELAVLVGRRGALDPRLAVSVTRQVTSALAAAHARGIVHRDMKPENIFVERDSLVALETGMTTSLSVKVIDFGISKARGERTNLTKTGMIMGTPSYMAPEQAMGQEVDHRADVYAVGAVLYFLLTGRKPFDSDDPTATLSMVLTQEPPRPRDLDSRIPEALELVVQRAMAKDQRDRYTTMTELDQALAALDGGRTQSGNVRVATPSALATSEGAPDALEVARVILGVQSSPPPAQAGTSILRAARPTIVVMSTALALWLVGGTTAALAGFVRVLHEGEITVTECVLLVVGCLFAAATPAALYVTHVKKVIWPNSARAVQLAADLKRTVTAVLVTYGFVSVVARIGLTVLFRSSRSLVSGWWDLVLLLVSLAVAATVGGARPLLANLRRRRGRA